MYFLRFTTVKTFGSPNFETIDMFSIIRSRIRYRSSPFLILKETKFRNTFWAHMGLLIDMGTLRVFCVIKNDILFINFS